MIRPELLEVSDEILRMEISYRHRVNNENNEFTDIFVYPTLILSEKNTKTKKFSLPIDEKMFTLELGKKFNGYTYGIGKIIRLAELNNDKLHNFVKEYFIKNSIEEFYERNSDCKKLKETYDISKNIETLTFGNLKNILGLIIKTDKVFHNIILLNDNLKRKNYRRDYENYILDRDRFTHGKLFFLYPSFEPILRIKDKVGINHYVNYNKNIFLSNLETFELLTEVIEEMIEIIKEK